MYVVRATKTFTTESSEYQAGEIYGLWGPKVKEARQLIKQGLLEEIDVEEGDDEDKSEPAPTGPAWSDAELGTFHFDDTGWLIRLPLPAFDAFNYGAKKKSKKKEPRQYPLTITANSEEELPKPGAIAMVRKLIANQATLATAAAEALWADFAGTGPDSGMYWHGDLDQVAEGLESGKPPGGVKDLYKLMKLGAVRVEKTGRSKAYTADLNFPARFEEEHGVGILTDGDAVIGIGYSDDVSPFKTRRPRAG
jgi:hypothetical protein